ncbi:hypothetical protein P691DRAFT_718074 [Macrolepiota fuliginosa MF-IS2]|uniref:Uncharacterized protein n=1 Tax=Macrolepiota fuliginosa MF-IS2 TaxID=1400762 RepID=A0A9P6C6X7_9AGAR|nr:hypothetical protein P691DRAFT_718074 [Macrolepiota fuliginosa MF-IS2]
MTIQMVAQDAVVETEPVVKAQVQVKEHPAGNPTRCERRLGDTEASYYLPSRESGVNDMYLHLGFNALPRQLCRDRVHLVWAILRARHPLLGARIEMHGYDDIRFVYDCPKRAEDILQSALGGLEFRSQTKNELIDSYLNGDRTLSNDRLSYLILSSGSAPQDGTVDENAEQTFDLLICATHYLGDGMALHTFANHFFGLLGGSLSENELGELLEHEFNRLYVGNDNLDHTLPRHVEDRLPPLPESKFFKAVSKVDFKLNQRKLLGGHGFPRRHNQFRHTIVPTFSFDPSRTKAILQNCKVNGVSISSALFALCNVAWARTHNQNWEQPIMMYSALNLRPFLKAEKALIDSYWFIAIGYFNVVLPAFTPQSSDIKSTFWYRARSAKKQSMDAAKHPLIVSRSIEMAQERASRARVWARQDDEAAGVVSPTPTTPPASIGNTPVPECLVPASKAPSTALLGLSLLGNLDGMYKHADFPRIKLHTLTTGSRQRSGGMLMFGYTFVRKLWISLGYDENGFEKEVVDKFWSNMLTAVDELL